MPALASNFELRKRQLDFSSSGQGQFDATELIVAGVQVANAIELLEFSDDMVQLFVCQDCGVTHCQSGSWASLRKIGERIALIPAIEAMREGEWEFNEYSPPKYMLTEGPILFDFESYKV